MCVYTCTYTRYAIFASNISLCLTCQLPNAVMVTDYNSSVLIPMVRYK